MNQPPCHRGFYGCDPHKCHAMAVLLSIDNTGALCSERAVCNLMFFFPENETFKLSSVCISFSYSDHSRGKWLSLQGAVGLRIRVYDRIMCFVNCHFAAHLDAVGRRNADFDHVYRTMSFSRPTNLLNAAAGTFLSLFLFFLLVLSMYLFWPVYRSGLPLVLCVAAVTSSSVPTFRGTNVCTCCLLYTFK